MNGNATATSIAQPHWQQLGEYLQQERLLLTEESRKQLQHEWNDVAELESKLDDALVIGLVGGTGVGKSTFINALAGEEISRSSDRRPTTSRVIVYRHVETEIPSDVPTDDFSQPQVLHDKHELDKVILFDFPDFDSDEKSHTDTLRRYLHYLDILLIVVDDVKYGDRRLYELLSSLDHNPDNLFVLLNKVDRLDQRYGDKKEQVVAELLKDLGEKLATNAGLQIREDQKFPISALAVSKARQRGETPPNKEQFEKVETLLAGFQEQKHRRAAKARNVDTRKGKLVDDLNEVALGGENRSVLQETRALVTNWRADLDQALQGISPDILSDRERRGMRKGRLRRVGPAWGIPFSLLFTLLGEWAGRRKSAAVEATGLGTRIYGHYRAFFEAINNLRARFSSELAGSSIAESMNAEDATQQTTSPETWTAALGTQLQQTIQKSEKKPTGRARVLCHLPVIATLFLAAWSQLHPMLQSTVEGSGIGFVGAVLKAMLSMLNPMFLIGILFAIVVVYAIMSLLIWLREVQTLERNITSAEADVRNQIRDRGTQAIDDLDKRVIALHDEFELVQQISGVSD